MQPIADIEIATVLVDARRRFAYSAVGDEIQLRIRGLVVDNGMFDACNKKC